MFTNSYYLLSKLNRCLSKCNFYNISQPEFVRVIARKARQKCVQRIFYLNGTIATAAVVAPNHQLCTPLFCTHDALKLHLWWKEFWNLLLYIRKAGEIIFVYFMCDRLDTLTLSCFYFLSSLVAQSEAADCQLPWMLLRVCLEAQSTDRDFGKELKDEKWSQREKTRDREKKGAGNRKREKRVSSSRFFFEK